MATENDLERCIEALSRVVALKELIDQISGLTTAGNLLVMLELAITHRLLNLEEGEK
jgi:hypothetical protein